MINNAHATIAANAATSAAPILLRGGTAPSKPYASTCAPPPKHSGFDNRRPPFGDRPQKSASPAIGLDSLTALNIFVHAAEACSFSDAGRRLGLSSSAVGKSIARLERRLGVELFHRNTRSAALTYEGKAFLESCRRIFSELQSAEDALAQARGAPKGKLRVSMPLNGMLMVPTLGNFIRDYPDVDLDIEFTDSLVDIVDGGYDVVLRSGEVDDSQLKSRRLGSYQFDVVGSPKYFAHAGVPLMPADLLNHSCLHRKHPTTGKLHPWPLLSGATNNDLVLPTTAVASTLDALVQLAESNVGIACVPNFCVRRQIADGSLVSILKEQVDHTEVVRAIWPSSPFQSPRLRAFIDFLAENVLPKSPALPAVERDAA
jgi:DNA-binding transcriptional LysR family regulator